MKDEIGKDSEAADPPESASPTENVSFVRSSKSWAFKNPGKEGSPLKMLRSRCLDSRQRRERR